MDPRSRRRRLQIATVALGCVPAAVLALRAATDRLGANPIEVVTHESGEWCLRLLILGLAVTPARRLLGWSWLAPLRRTVGLLAFGYACLHFFTFLVLEHFFEWTLIFEDLFERPFTGVGFFAFLCLVPLAVTSTDKMLRRLGRHWVRLHRLVYVGVAAGVVHFWWGAKADVREPLVYAAVLAALLATRVTRFRGALRGKPT